MPPTPFAPYVHLAPHWRAFMRRWVAALFLGCLASMASLNLHAAIPSVTSITPVGGGASTDISVDFTVSFSESAYNVSTDDFALGRTGSATGTIVSVSASSGINLTVTVSGISGNGTIKVNLNANTNIADGAGNAGPAAYTSGSTHNVAIPTAPGVPTIGTATAGSGQVSVTFTAPGNNGGSAITTYTATASPGGAFGTCAGPAACTATVTGLANGTAYTFTVTASNGVGTSGASGPSNSATPKGNQTITFANPGARNFGTTPTLTATATSSLTPTFTSSTTGVCTITSGGALTFFTAGSCTIDADQAGNPVWNAATTVAQTFTVNAVVPGAPTIGAATASDTQATVTFTAPASTGGAAIIASGYTVTASPGGANATGSSSPITVTGLTNGVSYTFSVTATNSAGTGNPSAASNSVTPASPQTITFGNPGTQNFGTTTTFTATADSGLTPTFTSSTTGVCTITSNGALTFLTAGACTINADQPGNGSYLPAAQVSRTFAVNPLLTVQGLAPGMAGTATATLSGGGATCTFGPASGFAAAVSNPVPAGQTMPHGEFAFQAVGCTPSVTVTLVYPEALPQGVQFWKHGPQTAAVDGVVAPSTWFHWTDAALSEDHKTVSYTITDNGVGDSDPAVGHIRDPLAAALRAADPGGAVPVLVDAPWALALLSALLGVLAWRRQRAQQG